MTAPRVLFLDIETCPHRVYVWGLWDQNVGLNQIEEPGYTLCWAAQWLGERRVMFSSVWGDGSKKMLKTIHGLLDTADVVVHYYGTKFDLPTLNQEFVIHGLGPPAPFHQIDLLQTARQRFRLPSNKLDYLARHLGLDPKLPTKGMDLWKGCMTGDPASLRHMERYNKRDVALLAEVYDRLKPWVVGHHNMGLFGDMTRPSCPSCGSTSIQRRGVSRTRTMIYRKFVCKACGAWSRERGALLTKDQKSNILVGV